MEEALRIGIFGDSLMKATLPDDSLRYHFHQEILDPFLAHVRGDVINKAKFGATIRKGKAILQKELDSGRHYDYALLEYGGNDCNHDWPDVAEHPDGDHFPVVSLQEFTDNKPWAHLDIAALAGAEGGYIPTSPKGSTGFGVSLMYHIVKQLEK